MGIWSKITKILPFGKRKPVGTDLQGNLYFEIPNPNGGRHKRIVEYASDTAAFGPRHVEGSGQGYRIGTQQLPAQWAAWMSYTRDTPPTMPELQRDAIRIARLQPIIARIAERERAERIEQGFLLPDGSEPGHRRVPESLQGNVAMPTRPLRIAEAEAGAQAEAQAQAQAAVESPQPPRHPVQPGQVGPDAQAEPIRPPTPPSEPAPTRVTMETPLAPPRAKVDPSANADELRALAEEDTRRRMRESGVGEVGVGAGAGVKSVGRAFKPRRRGEAK